MKAMTATNSYNWTSRQKVLFRISFIFIVLILVPFDPEWYAKLFQVSSIFDFFHVLSNFMPRYVTINSESGRWGLASYATLGAALLLAIIGGWIWTYTVRNKEIKNYERLYYWLKVAVRYRVALGIIAFGYIKLFPVQMPYPSLASLHTNFGDLSGYKLYWHAVGLVPCYQSFLGFVEVLAGTLLLFRPTVALGAIINFGVLYNIAHANHAYDGGVHLYSAYLSLLSLFLLVEYLPDVYQLLIKEQSVEPHDYKPEYSSPGIRVLARSLKYLTAFTFVIFYGYLRYDLHYVKHETKEPVTPGLPAIKGYYQVVEFRKNGQKFPYSSTDSVQWQDVIFEKYSTLVYRQNRKVSVPQSNGSRQEKDIDRNYELTGIAGGRKFMYYEADTLRHTLKLFDKSLSVVRNRELERAEKKKKVRTPQFVLSYERPDPLTVILKGREENGDELYLVLKKQDKRYPVQINRNL